MLFRSEKVFRKVVITHFERFKRTAGADVLFDDIPEASGFVGGFEDGLPFQISAADFGHDLLAVAETAVLQMEKRETPGKFFDPCDRICSALLDPVSVRLAFEIFGGRGGIEDIQHFSNSRA